MKYYSIIITLALISCGPGYYLKRSKANEKKAEQLGAKIEADTVYKNMKLKVAGQSVKFEPQIVRIHDSSVPLVFTKDSIVTKVLIRHDSIFAETKCPDKVVTIKVPYTVTKTISAPSKLPWWVYVVFGVSALVITVLCFKR